ncbi:MAG: radical SAM family heme chaperone HemW [Desulfovibrionaceae bacterium]|nr:radical SAM family heme chaperone HemW [Desulfovibrionaceae bacterium]
MLLYIHVPFCRGKCRYCAFYSEPLAGSAPGRGQERMQLWVDTLLMEMAQWADRLERPAVRTVFFGGGTPSLVPPDILSAVLNRVRRSFRLEPGAEISMEANPESLTRASARGYARAGINRVSLGVQALNDDLLAFLGRPHTVKDVMQAYNALRAANCHNISLDLIWGLPGQSVTAWLGQLGEVVRLRPEHVSCYGLSVEPGTPLAAMRDIDAFTLPLEREQATMYMRGAEILEEAGLLQYEISNFSRMGYQCRHNTGYWEGEDYLGLGPGATSTLGGRRWTNPADIAAWADVVRRHAGAADAEELTLTDRVLELVMLRLRTARGLRVKAYRALTGRDLLRDHKELIHALHRHGLIRIRHGYLWLTRSGMLVSNSILERFFDSVRESLTEGGPARPPAVAQAPDTAPGAEIPDTAVPDTKARAQKTRKEDDEC